jgi:peptidyl-prolyl cis-trans isomerase C
MRRHIAAALPLGLVLSACKPGADSEKASRSHEVLARIDDRVITQRDLTEALTARYAHMPFVLQRYSTLEKKKELLDNLVLFEVMALEAARLGLERDPDVQRVAKQKLVAQFEKREITDKLRVEDVPDAEVEAYYRAHPGEFAVREQVRVSHIMVRDKAKAHRVAAEARALAANDEKGFRELVARYSEDEDSSSRAGDLMRFDRTTARHPKPVVEAAFALTKIGEIGGPIQSDKGFHLLRLTERSPASTRSLAEAKPDIQRKLVERLRAKRKQELLEEARKRVKVEIYEDQLSKIELAPARAATPAGATSGAAPSPAPASAHVPARPTGAP